MFPTRQFEEKIEKQAAALDRLTTAMEVLLNTLNKREQYFRTRQLYFRRTMPVVGSSLTQDRLSSHQITTAAAGIQYFFEFEDGVETVMLRNAGAGRDPTKGGLYYAFERDADPARDMYLPPGATVVEDIRCKRLYVTSVPGSTDYPVVFAEGLI